MTDAERYRILSKSLEYQYKGIELSHVVALKIWGAARGKHVFSWYHLANLFLAYDFRRLKLPKENGFLSTFMEERRKDHLKLYNTVISRLTSCPVSNNLFDLKKRISFHPDLIIKLGYFFFLRLRRSGIPLGDKIKWFSEYVLLCNSIQELEKIDLSKVRKYLSMCHIIGLENLLTQFFREKGIMTYSLEEGIYMVYNKNFVIGSIAYENFATDHLLCWGQYTKDQYSEYGIESSKIYVAGYPKEQVLKSQKTNNRYKKCLVLLAGPLFGDVNSNLLSMLEFIKEEYEITLKSHPVNYLQMEAYANSHLLSIVPQKQTISDCLNKGEFDFCVAVNTTAYYESWMSGIPCIRYYDERFDIFYGFDDLFSTIEQFNQILEQYRQKTKTESEVKAMLEYAIGFGIDNYDRIVNG